MSDDIHPDEFAWPPRLRDPQPTFADGLDQQALATVYAAGLAASAHLGKGNRGYSVEAAFLFGDVAMRKFAGRLRGPMSDE